MALDAPGAPGNFRLIPNSKTPAWKLNTIIWVMQPGSRSWAQAAEFHASGFMPKLSTINWKEALNLLIGNVILYILIS
jgi:hypothetical protein